MKFLSLICAAVLLAVMPGAAHADPPPSLPEGHRHIVLRRGDPAPEDGVFADAMVSKYDLDARHWYETRITVCEEQLVKTADEVDARKYMIGGTIGAVLGLVAGMVLYGRYIAK